MLLGDSTTADICRLTSVTDATDEVHGSPTSDSRIEAVYEALLADSDGQSSCTVRVIKLDWESFSDHYLATLAASIDVVIATGLICF